jgi:hypothetical protein
MSDLLQDIIRRLSPIHVVMARGLSPGEIERLHEDLLALEREIERWASIGPSPATSFHRQFRQPSRNLSLRLGFEIRDRRSPRPPVAM